MLGSEYIKANLCVQCWRDGGQDGLDSMRACAFVIRNRVRVGWHNSDWLKVLSHHRDYAASNVPPQFELPDPRNYAFGLLLQEIDGIFAGTTEDDVTKTSHPSMGPIVTFDNQPSKPVALYYGRLGDPNLREWFLLNISRNTEQHSLVATVGGLSFFS
jgi:hypothetical protein